MSAARPAGAAPASSTSRSATSSTAIGCNGKAGATTTGDRRCAVNIPSTKEWNCVARRMLYGRPDSRTRRSMTTLSR